MCSDLGFVVSSKFISNICSGNVQYQPCACVCACGLICIWVRACLMRAGPCTFLCARFHACTNTGVCGCSCLRRSWCWRGTYPWPCSTTPRPSTSGACGCSARARGRGAPLACGAARLGGASPVLGGMWGRGAGGARAGLACSAGARGCVSRACVGFDGAVRLTLWLLPPKRQ